MKKLEFQKLKNQKQKLMKVLIESKADVNAVRKDHETELTRAAQKGNIHLVKALIKEAKAGVNIMNEWHMTPFMAAADKNKHEKMIF
jgi:ankyrin repeat protein